ncbi:lysozyme inhibitor LprI family protein [Geomonas sp. Red32]|uniref:lysozyme inhibitor LprI family protein n=1 Tax=Geomonas sp. Red32 TaxID=2912856 RepID=UPI00202CFB05|nr:lysozyme inhibitor LprI family protein [Geomonas sp. Red32]MCM0083312.1 lysozyme inhibitor LprI family protein [Geomonas sp. Red32]
MHEKHARRTIEVTAIGMARLLVLIMVTEIFSCPALAASFDCKSAKSKAEKMICSNATLSKLDDDLALAYAQALIAAPDREALKKEQRAWVRGKRNACSDVRCMASTYQERIGALSKPHPATSLAEIKGIWENLSPDVGGRYSLTVMSNFLLVGTCKPRFILTSAKDGQYVFTSASNKKCSVYSGGYDLVMIKLELSDKESLHASYYNGTTEKDLILSTNFFKVE